MDTNVTKETPEEGGRYPFQSVEPKWQTKWEQGGVYHALIGTVLITLAATVISVPIGVLAAIYLVEYGGKSRLAVGRTVPPTGRARGSAGQRPSCRAISIRCTSEVPSPISRILASR